MLLVASTAIVVTLPDPAEAGRRTVQGAKMEGIRTRRPRWCCARNRRWQDERSGEGRYARCPSQRTVTPEHLGHPKLGVASELRVWSATRSAILVRAVPGALLQQHGRQLYLP